MTHHAPAVGVGIFAAALALFSLTDAANARESCQNQGDPFKVISSKAGIGKDQIVYRNPNGSYCYSGQVYGRREVRAVALNKGISSRECGTQTAEAKNFSGGAARGNGC